KLGRRKRQAGDVATRPRQTGDKASAKRVRHRREYDWDNRGRLFRCEDRRSRCDNNIDLETDKLGGDLGETLEASLRPTNLDDDGTALDPPEFAQPLFKSGDPLARGGTRLPAQKPDGRQLARLLGPAVSGHAAAPPSRLMNSRRRIILSPRRREQAASAALRG